ncbi:MAG: GNAT family N-acetyltransferase [Anaerolineae bacterium]
MIARLYSEESKPPIRPLNPARDFGQLADLIENAFGEELSDGGTKVLREIRFLSRLGPLNYLLYGTGSELDSIFSGFVWEHDGRIVGNVSLNRAGGRGSRWQISNVAVLDRFRRQGIGKELMEAALDFIASRGGEVVYLYVREDNEPALHLYRELGFAELERLSELELLPQHRSPPQGLELLHPLKAAEQPALYELVRVAEGPGQRWLGRAQRRRYVMTADERLLKWLGGLFTGEHETRWVVAGATGLDAAVVLQSTHLWNLRPHRLRLWVYPSRRGDLEEQLASDVMRLLSWQPARPTWASLPASEWRATTALVSEGFRLVRTLILMRRQL